MTKPKPFTELNPKNQLRKANPDLTPEAMERLDKIIKLFESYGLSTKNADDKRAYPNYDQYMNIPNQHNMEKWINAVKTIYSLEKNGINRIQCIHQATSGWKITEISDFLNWLRFYEQGAHLKYKMAQLWYENGAPGYFLQIKPDPVKETPTQITDQDIDFAREEASSNAEKRQIIEKQRSKIIGRLDSA